MAVNLPMKLNHKIKEMKLIEELQTLLSDVHQLLTGWHSDGTAWSEWDEQVRNRVEKMQEKVSDFNNNGEKEVPDEVIRLYLKIVREHTNVKIININIKEGENNEPTLLASIPEGGIVKEYVDRYEWDVIHHQGLSLMKVYKKDFVSVEILL